VHKLSVTHENDIIHRHTLGWSLPPSSFSVRRLGGAMDMVAQSLVGNVRSVLQWLGCTVQYWRPNGLNTCASRAHSMSSVLSCCVSRLTKELHQYSQKFSYLKVQITEEIKQIKCRYVVWNQWTKWKNPCTWPVWGQTWCKSSRRVWKGLSSIWAGHRVVTE